MVLFVFFEIKLSHNFAFWGRDDKKAGPYSDLLGVFSHTNLYIY